MNSFFEIETPEILWEKLKKLRNQLLQNCDWTQFNDTPLNNEQKQQWATYRQELRDVPQKFSNPQQVIWPQPPNK